MMRVFTSFVDTRGGEQVPSPPFWVRHRIVVFVLLTSVIVPPFLMGQKAVTFVLLTSIPVPPFLMGQKL